QHVYRPMTVDVTLKDMLSRWAREAGLRLRYEHPSDFVLHTPVLQIQQPNLDAALAELNGIFASQNVRVEAFGGVLVARSTVVGGESFVEVPAAVNDVGLPAQSYFPPLPKLAPPPDFPVFTPIQIVGDESKKAE
ncbi:MAG: hypothetical protein ACRCV6_07930, partial [Formosimonas sp.]